MAVAKSPPHTARVAILISRVASLRSFVHRGERQGEPDADCSFQDRAGPASESPRFHLRLKRLKETKMETKAVGQLETEGGFQLLCFPCSFLVSS